STQRSEVSKTSLRGFLFVLSVFCGGAFSNAHAQLQRIKADLTPVLEADGAHAGDVVRGALSVSLPDGFHVQSNKPRDPLLIATELAIQAPDGVTVKELVFPAPVDLKQQGADQPLAVFERSFAVGVQFTVAPSTPTGTLRVPARLHYQACNDTT